MIKQIIIFRVTYRDGMLWCGSGGRGSKSHFPPPDYNNRRLKDEQSAKPVIQHNLCYVFCTYEAPMGGHWLAHRENFLDRDPRRVPMIPRFYHFLLIALANPSSALLQNITYCKPYLASQAIRTEPRYCAAIN